MKHTKKAASLISKGGFVLNIVLNAKTLSEAKEEASKIFPDHYDRRILELKKGEIINTTILNKKEVKMKNEVENTAVSLFKIANELLPKAVLISEDEFSQKLKLPNKYTLMCSKESFSFWSSEELRKAVEDVEFSYILVMEDGECFITNEKNI